MTAVLLAGDPGFTLRAERALLTTGVLMLRAPVEAAYELDPELVVLLGYMDRVPDHLLTDYTVLGFHPSLLPRYRGGSAIKWQLHDLQFRRVRHRLPIDLGASIYRLLPGAKMDSGPVVAQERLVAPRPLTAGSLYRAAQDAGLRALVAAVGAWLDGTYTETPQDEAAASWHPRLRPGQSPAEYLDAHRTSQQAHA